MALASKEECVMKKSIVVLSAVALIAIMSAGAFGLWWVGGSHGQRGDGSKTVDLRESVVRAERLETPVNKPFNTLKTSGDGLTSTALPRGKRYGYCDGWSRWNTPTQPGTAPQSPQMTTEAKVKAIAETYVK
jgi:hypothetical protein